MIWFQIFIISSFLQRPESYFFYRTITMSQSNDVSIHNRLYGEWIIWRSSSSKHTFLNRQIVSIYPNKKILVSYRYKKGPFLFCQEKQGLYTLKKKKLYHNYIISLHFYSKKNKLLSVYGVGTQDFFDDYFNTNLLNETINMNMYCIGSDDLYLSSYTDDINYHLIRSVRVNEPKIDVPISTLVFTQILSILITYVLHFVFLHIGLYI